MSERCLICLVSDAVMHSHHTVPRSRGGDNSKQITLCAGCHNCLHANALAIIRRIKGGSKKPVKQFWKEAEQETRANPWLEILVRAMMSPPVCEREHLLSISVAT